GPGAGGRSPSTGSARPDPTMPNGSTPRSTSGASCSARATDARRRRPSKRRPARRSPAWSCAATDMPELPEVEVIRRDLEKEVVGRQIRCVEVRNTKNAMRVIRRHRKRRELEEPLAGTRVTGIERRGKYLVFHLDSDLALVVHLGMSGQLLQTARNEGIQNHTHVVFDLSGGDQLRFVDPRTFGEMFVTTKGESGEIRELRSLGLDPLENQLTWQHFSQFLAAHKVKLKSLLMDQRFVAGIGNIYSDEI